MGRSINRPRKAQGGGGIVIWLTGLSGAGKSTLALAVEGRLRARGHRAVSVDGDDLRRGLCSDLGFMKEDRSENVRRAAEVGTLLARTGTACIVALISPYAEDRARARDVATREGVPFLEVFVDAPLAVCEQRDPKGLYRLARAGSVSRFTGVSDPYEAPANPDVHVMTHLLDPIECVSRVVMAVTATLRLPAADQAVTRRKPVRAAGSGRADTHTSG